MPGKETARSEHRRGRRSLRHLALAAMLAALKALLTSGMVLAAPRGAIHAFPVAIGGRARFLNFHTPGGFERYMREIVAMRARGETPTEEFFRSHDQFNV